MSAIAFQMPSRVSVHRVDDTHGVFIFKPLEKGYGATLGNALRRVLLSSLQGYAITSFHIPGVQHEFSTIEGVREDLVAFGLNIKQVRLKKVAEEVDLQAEVTIQGKSVFTAADLAPALVGFEVLNPELVLCHLAKGTKLQVAFTLDRGRGYVPAEEHKPEDAPLGLIPVDAIYTPIRQVKYQVANTRVEQRTDYEEMTLEIQTDGSIASEEALREAASILMRHFHLCLGDKPFEPLEEEETEHAPVDEDTMRTRENLLTPVDELGLSVRAYNCLKAAGIHILGDLVALEISDVIKLRNFGRKSLKEIEELVAERKLSFGMSLTRYNLGTRPKVTLGVEEGAEDIL